MDTIMLLEFRLIGATATNTSGAYGTQCQCDRTSIVFQSYMYRLQGVTCTAVRVSASMRFRCSMSLGMRAGCQ